MERNFFLFVRVSVYRAHAVPLLISVAGFTDAQRVTLRPVLQHTLKWSWFWPVSDVTRMNSLLTGAFARSASHIKRNVFRDTPWSTDQNSESVRDNVLRLISNDIQRTFVPEQRFAHLNPRYLHTLMVHQQTAPAFQHYVNSEFGLQPCEMSAIDDVDNLRGVGMRALNFTGSIIVQFPANGVLILFPNAASAPAIDGSGAPERHSFRSHENTMCFTRTGSTGAVECGVLDSQFEPSIIVSSLADHTKVDCVYNVNVSADKSDMHFETHRYGRGGVVVMFRGNLTYRVDLSHADFVFAAVDSAERAMEVTLRETSADSPLRAGYFERNLIWATGKPFAQLPFHSRFLAYDTAVMALTYPTASRGSTPAETASFFQRYVIDARERGDATCYPYVHPAEIAQHIDGTVSLYGTSQVAMRRDRAERGARGDLVLFLDTGTLMDTYPIGRLVRNAARTMQAHANEQPYRYERYLEHQPDEHVVICGNSRTVKEALLALSEYFGPPTLSFKCLNSTEVVVASPAPLVASVDASLPIKPQEPVPPVQPVAQGTNAPSPVESSPPSDERPAVSVDLDASLSMIASDAPSSPIGHPKRRSARLKRPETTPLVFVVAKDKKEKKNALDAPVASSENTVAQLELQRVANEACNAILEPPIVDLFDYPDELEEKAAASIPQSSPMEMETEVVDAPLPPPLPVQQQNDDAHPLRRGVKRPRDDAIQNTEPSVSTPKPPAKRPRFDSVRSSYSMAPALYLTKGLFDSAIGASATPPLFNMMPVVGMRPTVESTAVEHYIDDPNVLSEEVAPMPSMVPDYTMQAPPPASTFPVEEKAPFADVSDEGNVLDFDIGYYI